MPVQKTQVKFFGLILLRQGVSPDPAKIEALKRLPEPRDEKLLQSFLKDGQLFVKI